MDSSDDEGERFPGMVTGYYFMDDKEEPISFAALPNGWSTRDAFEAPENKIYVRGKTNNGLENLYKSVKAWRFDISGHKPEISVLLEDNNWIILQKPRNSYEEFSRAVLITVNFLHIVKRNPDLHGKFLWDKLSKIFRLLEDKPSPDDLIDHKALIEKAVEHDDSLKKSKYLMTYLENNLQKENIVQENARSKGKNAFIVDDDDCMANDIEQGGSVDEGNGSVDKEDESDSEEDDDDIFDSVCCICDEGGSILCCDGICTRSFHATRRDAKDAKSKCSSLGFSTMEVEAMPTFKCQNCQYKRHQCYSCGMLGSSDKESGAEVFQCVNATCGYFYHPGCVAKQLHPDDVDAVNALQKDIAAGEAFTCPLHLCVVCRQPENKTNAELRMAVCRRCPTAYHAKCMPREIVFEADEDEGTVQRAWDGLLVDRILIYCLKHEINDDLGTPLRDHIKFPGDNKKEKPPLRQQRVKHKVVPQYKKPPVMDLSRQGPAVEAKKYLLQNKPSKTDEKISKPKGIGTMRKLSVEKKSVSIKVERKCSAQLDLVKPSKLVNTAARKPELESDSEARVRKLIEEASSKISLDKVIEKHQKQASRHVYKQRTDTGKIITMGKVEGFCKAVRIAAQKLDEGKSVEEAKTVCDSRNLDQGLKWQIKLRVYLAPFLHGMTYTSFGRHFTKIDKLKEIVDKLHWYVNNNDTVVDFCCGSNDFSSLLKQKLDSVGKTCNYKNYDIFPPQNDFSFEKRDWNTVQPKELPIGSQLIMGLNPPFGVKGCFANQFIDKALQFKPKLIILIVPPETERLDEKKTPYDLVWEDRNKLSGKSFYIPGSRDKNNKHVEDWNNSTSILYLWSRPDWTTKHKNVAKTHGHLHGERDSGNYASRPGREQVAVKKTDDVSALTNDHKQFKEKAAASTQAPLKDDLGDVHVSSAELNKRRRSEEIYAKDIDSPREYKRGRSSPFNPHQEWPHRLPDDVRGGNLSSPLTYPKYPANLETSGPAYDHFEQSTGYGDTRSRFEIPGSYSDRVGVHYPPIDIHPADYPQRGYLPRNPGEWDPGHPAYMRGPDSYETNQHFNDPAYSSMAPMSVIDKYCPRLDEPNHVRVSGYIPDHGHPSEPHMYDHYEPRQGYHGAPTGSVPHSFESFPMVSTSKDSKKQGKGKKNRAKDGVEQKCFNCNELGHFKRDCPKAPKRGTF